MPEAPVPQNLSSEVAKAAVLPDVLKHSTVDWVKVKKVDGMLDKIPEINTRGAKIEVNEQVDAEKMRSATKIKAGEKETNLVDFVTADEQLRIMLQEGQRLGLIKEQDFIDIGVKPELYKKGKTDELRLPTLGRLQKAEAISLILHRLGEANSSTTTMYLDQASNLMLDSKKVDLQGKGVFSNLTLLNALAAGGREELSKYIIEQGYDPYTMKASESQAQRRIMAKLVKEAYGDEEVTKVLSGETPYFVEQGGKPEYSAMIDMHIAQAITNVMIPAEVHVIIAKLEDKVRTASTVAEAQDLRHEITRSRQKVYASLLNAFNVKGYETDGEVYKNLGFSVGDQVEIDRMAKMIKERPSFKESQKMTMFEANRASLAQVGAEITGINVNNIRDIVLTLPIEQTVEMYREQARQGLIPEDLIESRVRGHMADLFTESVGGADKEKVLDVEQKKLLEKFFIKTYDTERALIKKGHRRFSEADAPTKVKIGTPEAINQGIKGLDLLFRRSVTEQQYDWETYKKLVIEGAAQAEPTVPGAVLEQGQQREVAKVTEDKKNEDWDKALAEEENRNAFDEAKAEDEARNAAILEEEKTQKERTEFLNRKPSESLAISEGAYINELMEKIDTGNATSQDIQDEMNSILNIPKGSEHWFSGPVRKVKELVLKDAEKKKLYAQLKSALVIARQYEAIPAENEDEIEEARKQFFVPRNQEGFVASYGPNESNLDPNKIAESWKKKDEEEKKPEAPTTPLPPGADIPPFLRDRK